MQLVSALVAADLVVTSVQPVKAEMSTASPKSGAREPSNLDSIVVCRKPMRLQPLVLPADAARAASIAFARLQRLVNGGISVGAADCRSVIWGSVLAIGTQPAKRGSLKQLATDAENLGEQYVQRLNAERG